MIGQSEHYTVVVHVLKCQILLLGYESCDVGAKGNLLSTTSDYTHGIKELQMSACPEYQVCKQPNLAKEGHFFSFQVKKQQLMKTTTTTPKGI